MPEAANLTAVAVLPGTACPPRQTRNERRRRLAMRRDGPSWLVSPEILYDLQDS
jgi:hypothetical protein